MFQHIQFRFWVKNITFMSMQSNSWKPLVLKLQQNRFLQKCRTMLATGVKSGGSRMAWSNEIYPWLIWVNVGEFGTFGSPNFHLVQLWLGGRYVFPYSKKAIFKHVFCMTPKNLWFSHNALKVPQKLEDPHTGERFLESRDCWNVHL